MHYTHTYTLQVVIDITLNTIDTDFQTTQYRIKVKILVSPITYNKNNYLIHTLLTLARIGGAELL